MEERVMQELKETIERLSRDVSGLREVVRRLDETITVMQKNAAKSHVHELEDHHNGDVASGSIGGANKKMRKYSNLKLPLFAGEDPLGWLIRIERYFHVYATTENEKVDVAVICLEGKALNWFRFVEARAPLRDWPEFKRRLLRRFFSSQHGGLYEILFSTKQERSVLEYVEEFERLSVPLEEASEECLIGAFCNGLKTEIKAELRLTNATTLTEIMEMARCIDERNQILEEERTFRVARNQSSFVEPDSNRGTATGCPVRKGGNSSLLSDSELARRTELGLCLK